MAQRSDRATVGLRRLRDLFRRNGYVRSPPDRRAQPTTHRGYELRFTALDVRERDEIVRLLRAVGVTPGKPFEKGSAWRVPVYGHGGVHELLAAMNAE